MKIIFGNCTEKEIACAIAKLYGTPFMVKTLPVGGGKLVELTMGRTWEEAVDYKLFDIMVKELAEQPSQQPS